MVWLNGHFLGRHLSGYTSYRYDITQCANYGGKNVLVVYVDPSSFEGWWYEGGGIYRHVWLNVAEPVHLAPWGTFVTTQLPEPAAQPSQAEVSVASIIANDSSSEAAVTLMTQVLDEKDSVVATVSSPARIAAGQRLGVTNRMTVAQPLLWSIETPHLYKLVSLIKRGSETVDQTETAFGIRTIRFDVEKGFFLNGKPVKIQGTCNHQDFAGVGVAVPDTLEYRRVKMLKDMGANAWRMSHNPPTPELLDACDKLGMLVMDENRHLGNSSSILEEVASLVQRDRNHPSVIMWSMCNEEGRQGSAEGTRLFSAMMEVTRRYDPTRPVTSAMNGGWLEPVNFGQVEDLVGVNYYPDQYDAIHKHHPTKPMFGSETASTLTTRGEYADNKEKTFVTFLQHDGRLLDARGGTSVRRGQFRVDRLRLQRRTHPLQVALHQQPFRDHGHVRVSQGQLLLLFVMVEDQPSRSCHAALELARQRRTGNQSRCIQQLRARGAVL